MWSREFLEGEAKKRQLTEEQKAVFLAKLLGNNRSDVQIATELNVTADAVRNRLSGVYQKFGIDGKGTGKYARLLELLTRELEKFRADVPQASNPVKREDAIAISQPCKVSADRSDNNSKATTSQSDPNFVGRSGAIAHLNTLVRQGAKVIVIQTAGGVGKTTLAREYLKTQGFDLVLELLMAKEKENITAIESVLEEWLKQDLKEEPGREFGVMLRRLKRQLQTRRIGVLIDNLEPALDKQGRFIEPHRRYVELLRVLADSTVQSVTLITSRERLCESSLNVESYRLAGLDEQAWHQFFSSRSANIDVLVLSVMHKAYGGNAKAIGILCGAIREDFDGDMAAYWLENGCDLLVERDLEDLVTCQFNRLQQIDPEAYKLLCRLGCYRYQDVATVPTEGLLCLLWDVEEPRRRRIIESLRNRSLVEFHKGEYWLHPMIRAEAIARLKASKDWEKTNGLAADFWAENVNNIETIQDAVKALEGYFHCLSINNFERACDAILKARDNRWQAKSEGGESLISSLMRLGLLKQSDSLLNQTITNIISSYRLYIIYDTMGWLKLNLKQRSQIIQNQSNFWIKSALNVTSQKLTTN